MKSFELFFSFNALQNTHIIKFFQVLINFQFLLIIWLLC
jgi:hypothetical protein